MMLSLLLSVVSNAQIVLLRGYENFDNKLTFPYAKESGIYSDYCTPTLIKESWNYPGELISQLKSISSINNRFAADYDFIYNGDGFEFVDGRYRSYEDSLLIQVSQNDMDMTNAEIALINSDGEDMIEIGYVEVVNVKRHNEAGLWVIKFKLNEAKIADLLDKGADYLNKKYAVAVKGVDNMVSGYDVCLGLEEVKHAYDTSTA